MKNKPIPINIGKRKTTIPIRIALSTAKSIVDLISVEVLTTSNSELQLIKLNEGSGGK